MAERSFKSGKLPRLQRESYCGFAAVHWTYAVADRRSGWLCEAFHCRLRELLLHALHRYGLACSAYTLMPDHAHLLLIGLAESSDQTLFSRYFRRHFFGNAAFELQKQPHDHVLRNEEKTTDSFQAIAHYILENPVRAGIVEQQMDYPFSGNAFPGFFDLDWKQTDYWERYWRAYNYTVTKA